MITVSTYSMVSQDHWHNCPLDESDKRSISARARAIFSPNASHPFKRGIHRSLLLSGSMLLRRQLVAPSSICPAFPLDSVPAMIFLHWRQRETWLCNSYKHWPWSMQPKVLCSQPTHGHMSLFCMVWAMAFESTSTVNWRRSLRALARSACKASVVLNTWHWAITARWGWVCPWRVETGRSRISQVHSRARSMTFACTIVSWLIKRSVLCRICNMHRTFHVFWLIDALYSMNLGWIAAFQNLCKG